MSDSESLKEHKKKWDALAVENDRYYVRSVDHEQSDEEYDESGWKDVKNFLENDPMIRNCIEPFDSGVVLEIGCGSGRITKTLSRLFKHVVAVDISPTMLEKARVFVSSDNVTFVESNGADVPVQPETIDLAFSYIVYQHFSSADAIEESFRGVCRALRPRGIFKTQIRGQPHPDSRHWSWGPHYDEAAAARLAASTGFRILSASGAGSRSYWLLLEKM